MNNYKIGFEAELGAMQLDKKPENKAVLAQVIKDDKPFLNIVSEGANTENRYFEFVSMPNNDKADIEDYFMFLKLVKPFKSGERFTDIFNSVISKMNEKRKSKSGKIIFKINYGDSSNNIKVKRNALAFGGYKIHINMDIPITALYCNENNDFLNIFPSIFKNDLISKYRSHTKKLIDLIKILSKDKDISVKADDIGNDIKALLTILYYQCHMYSCNSNITPPEYRTADLITNVNRKDIKFANIVFKGDKEKYEALKLHFSVLIKAGMPNIINMLAGDIKKMEAIFDNADIKDEFNKHIRTYTATALASKSGICFDNILNNIKKCSNSSTDYIYDEPRVGGLIEPKGGSIVIELRKSESPFVRKAEEAADENETTNTKLNELMAQITAVYTAFTKPKK